MKYFVRKSVRDAARQVLDIGSRAGSEKLDDFATLRKSRANFERELRRARRYERPLGVLVLLPLRSERFAMLGAMLRDALRETDLVSHVPETAEFVALLPEADDAALEQSSDRLQQLWCGPDTLPLQIGTAAYPTAGLTLNDLLDAARRASRTRTAPNDPYLADLRDAAHG